MDVPALILAGGLGTRLRGALPGLPKALAPLHGRPFLAYLLDRLEAGGVREVILCTGYRAEQISAVFGRRYRGLSVRYSLEPRPLGTAGALRLALAQTDAEHVLVLNGDSAVDCPLDGFHRWHRAREDALAGSLVLAWADDATRFGTVEPGPRGTILAFREKCADSRPGWINAGAYLLRRSLLDAIPPERNVSLEREMFPLWIGQGLGAYTTRGRFIDIGTPESLAQASRWMAEGPRCSRELPCTY